jgi:ribosomal protein L11 methylase PrmA
VTSTTPGRLGASFRDPSGFVYRADGVLYRQVNDVYQLHFDALLASGLYVRLTKKRWLVPHDEVPAAPGAYRTLRPAEIPYISYPYEWCFGQLKAAALLTLDLQQEALTHGLVLKDASAYNIQFVGYRPVLIDTLSFEIYEDGAPWVAYRQFCQHFLAPLALESSVDPRLRRLSGEFIDGVPLDLASRLLPRRTWARPGLLTHVHLHARSQQKHQAAGRGGAASARAIRVSKTALVALIDGLRRTVAACTLPARRTEWSDYYSDTNYSDESMTAKESLVAEFVDAVAVAGRTIHDFGANTGRFSRLIARPDRYVVAHDVDEMAVEHHYRHVVADKSEGVLPLVLDLTNPSPARGWALEERDAITDRMAGDTVVALALIHHLAISNNVPLDRLAAFFARLAAALVIEFVPKEDSQVQRLLATRKDIFPTYTIEDFERTFGERFEIVRRTLVPGTSRTLYAMRRKPSEIGLNPG